MRKPDWLPFCVYRPIAIFHILGVLAKVSVWQSYVFDEPRRTMILVTRKFTLIAYRAYAYKWMPALK